MDFLKTISLLSISTLSSDVGLKYETYMDYPFLKVLLLTFKVQAFEKK